MFHRPRAENQMPHACKLSSSCDCVAQISRPVLGKTLWSRCTYQTKQYTHIYVYKYVCGHACICLLSSHLLRVKWSLCILLETSSGESYRLFFKLSIPFLNIAAIFYVIRCIKYRKVRGKEIGVERILQLCMSKLKFLG